MDSRQPPIQGNLSELNLVPSTITSRDSYSYPSVLMTILPRKRSNLSQFSRTCPRSKLASRGDSKLNPGELTVCEAYQSSRVNLDSLQ